MPRLSIDAQRLRSARTHDRRCLLCEHRCGIDRWAGERGPCKAGCEARVFRHRVEYGEELELIPSHLFYLSGCDLRCAFCIAEANAFDPRRGRELTPTFFADAVAWGRHQDARNVQWVGGEPTIHLPRILEVMANVEHPCQKLETVGEFTTRVADSTPSLGSIIKKAEAIFTAVDRTRHVTWHALGSFQ